MGDERIPKYVPFEAVVKFRSHETVPPNSPASPQPGAIGPIDSGVMGILDKGKLGIEVMSRNAAGHLEAIDIVGDKITGKVDGKVVGNSIISHKIAEEARAAARSFSHEDITNPVNVKHNHDLIHHAVSEGLAAVRAAKGAKGYTP